MIQLLKKFMGEGPHPYPLEVFPNFANIYSTPNFMVSSPKTEENVLDKASHAHESYEFLIPYTTMPLGKIDKNTIVFEPNKLYVHNSYQCHGPDEPFFGFRLLNFHVDKSFLQDMARLIYGREEVVFENGSFAIDSELKDLIRSFTQESINRQAGYSFMMESISTQIVVKLLRQLKSNMPVAVKEHNYSEKNNVNRVIEFFMEHYNLDYSLEAVARVANLSPYHFIRVFKAYTGKTPYDYLLDIKINKAREMLRYGSRDLTITQICYLCGFNNLNHFNSVFKRKVGVSPSGYRKAL